MICPNCGNQVPDGMRCPCGGGERPLSSNPAVHAVKAVSSSSLFLTASILFSVSILFTILASFGGNAFLEQILYRLYSMGYDVSEFSMYLSNLRWTGVLSAVFGSAFNILLAVGLWLHYSTCRRTDTGNISTAGLTICKVIAVIRCVFTGFALLLILGGCVLMIIGLGAASLSGMDEDVAIVIMTFAIVLLIFGIIFGVLGLIYQIFIVKTINRIKSTAVTGRADNRISGFVIIWTYIVSVTSIIGGIFSLFTGVLGGLAAIAGAVSSFIIAKCLSDYKKRATMLMYPPVQPVAVPQMPPQQNP